MLAFSIALLVLGYAALYSGVRDVPLMDALTGKGAMVPPSPTPAVPPANPHSRGNVHGRHHKGP